jgi:hypothetical protein
MQTDGEREPDLLNVVQDRDLDAREPQRSSRTSSVALKVGLVGFGLVLLSVVFLPRQDVVRWVLYAAVGAVAALLLPSSSTIIRSMKAGAIAGLIAAVIAFGIWFILLVTVASPFLDSLFEYLYPTNRWSGFLSEFVWTAAWNLLGAVVLGALGSGLVGALRRRRRRSR